MNFILYYMINEIGSDNSNFMYYILMIFINILHPWSTVYKCSVILHPKYSDKMAMQDKCKTLKCIFFLWFSTILKNF